MLMKTHETKMTLAVELNLGYTGTHDNNTTIAWYENELTDDQRQNLSRYLARRKSDDELHWQFIRLAMNSAANLAIIPMQDILGLGQDARMNLPGTHTRNNWIWRMSQRQLTPALAAKLKQVTVQSRRR